MEMLSRTTREATPVCLEPEDISVIVSVMIAPANREIDDELCRLRP